MKKIISIILVSIICLSSLASCAIPPIMQGNTDTSGGGQIIQPPNNEQTDKNNGSQNNNTNNNTNNNINNNGQKDENDQAEEKLPAGTVPVFKSKEFTAKIIGNSASKSFTNNISTLFARITGKAPNVSTTQKSYDGIAILVGETDFPESQTVYKSLKSNEAKAVLSGNKYVIAYSNDIAAANLYEKLREKLSKQPKDRILLDKSWNISVTGVDRSPAALGVSNKVLACDQNNKNLILYDFSNYKQTTSLDSMGKVIISNIGALGEAKYREGTVHGNVIAITSGSKCGIYSYPAGKAIWTTSSGGNNPHSIEVLPSGNIVIASSTGGTLRLFKTSALTTGNTSTANQYTDYTLEDAHGVLWDPTYKVLWALGRYQLKAYYVTGSGTGEKLVEATQLTINLPEGHRGGHDLSPDYTDTRYLYITVGEMVLKVDKLEHKLIANFFYSSLMTARNVKGFSNNPGGNFFITGELGGAGRPWDNASFESWCTDTIYFCVFDGKTYTKVKLTSENSAFYKARAFCGAYQ